MGTSIHQRRRRISRRQMKIRIVVVFLVAVVCVTTALVLLLHKPTPPPTPEDTPPAIQTPAVTISLPQKFIDNNTASQYIVLYDATAGKTLYSKQADVKCYPASLTKLVTASVALKYANTDTVFTVGEEIRMIDPESSRAYLRMGQRLDLQTILEALMLPSGNDAAYTIAANVGRIIAGDENLATRSAIQTFCDKMNELARELGMKNSHFANPDGIHEADHYTTAADMLLVANHVCNQPLLAEVMKQGKVTRSFLSGESGMIWHNTNRLVQEDARYFMQEATGMKTGHTDQAGYCLAASAEDEGVRLITILMGADSNDGRFDDAQGLFTICYDSIEN